MDKTGQPTAGRQFRLGFVINSGLPADVVRHPLFAEKPTGPDVSALYPTRALRLGIEGHAAMFCRATQEGALDQCAIASEQPADVGFGSAAVQIATKFKLQSLDADGAPVAGRRVLIRMNFSLPHPTTSKLPPPQAVSLGTNDY